MTQFERYQGLIRKIAWKYSKKYGVAFEDLEGQGYIVYLECLNNWDCKKSSFITHLYCNLTGRLNNYAKDILPEDKKICYWMHNENKCIDIPHKDKEQIDWLESFRRELSDPAYQLLLWIISFEWHGKGRNLPTIPQSAEYFHSTRFKMIKYWKELEKVYREKGLEFILE